MDIRKEELKKVILNGGIEYVGFRYEPSSMFQFEYIFGLGFKVNGIKLEENDGLVIGNNLIIEEEVRDCLWKLGKDDFINKVCDNDDFIKWILENGGGWDDYEFKYKEDEDGDEVLVIDNDLKDFMRNEFKKDDESWKDSIFEKSVFEKLDIDLKENVFWV